MTKARTLTVEQALKNADTQRLKAIGAQESLREEVRLLQDTVRCKDEVIVAQATTIGHAEEAASKERTARIVAERERDELRKEVEHLRERATSDRVENGRLNGMLDMLARLGTIPVKPDDGTFAPDAYPYMRGPR